MTNFILSALATLALTVASITMDDEEPNAKNRLSEEQQIEIYEQVMDGCVVNK